MTAPVRAAAASHGTARPSLDRVAVAGAAREPQVQERLTTQVAGWLARTLRPKGVGVVVEAEHLCMALRGVRKPGTKTVTSALHGLVRDDPRTREEFLSLTGWRSG